MTDYTITLTDIEVKSLEYSVNGILGWIENAAKNRARIAKNEIIALNTAVSYTHLTLPTICSV